MISPHPLGDPGAMGWSIEFQQDSFLMVCEVGVPAPNDEKPRRGRQYGGRRPVSVTVGRRAHLDPDELRGRVGYGPEG